MNRSDAQFLRTNAPWLGAGLLLTFSSSYGQTFFIAVFAGDIRETFALSHGAWGGIYAAGTLCAALVMVWAGTLTDRFRARTIGTVNLCLMSLACMAMALVPSGWALVPVILALRLFGQGMMGQIAITAMSRWFVATRGRALSITSLGFALGEGLLPVLFATLLAGGLFWREAWMLAALLPLAAIPLLRVLLRAERTPRGDQGIAHSSGRSGRHWQRRDMLRDPLFWWLVPALTAPPAFVTALFFQQVHLADTKGWAHVQLVALFPAYTASGVAATLASGWLIDRLGAVRILPIFLLPMALGFLLMSWTATLSVALVALVLVAMAQGTFHTANAAALTELYGTRHIGAIRALAIAVMVFATAIGPVITGLLIDTGLPFSGQMPWIAAWMLIASLLAQIGLIRSSAFSRHRPPTLETAGDERP
ncbi:MAG: MFS transporter [Pseudomonadota bacterium]